ncbi:hypothetical protein ACQI5H_22580 [Mycobacterium heidelbergense]|uniref:WXG100 family type VII secretion target n=1 Tax=Mycobacterium heidelbergense TaxID=53376 RepID=UPI003CF2D04A
MAAEFRASPEELRRVSRDLHEVSSAMKTVMATLRAELAAEGPVWGDGDIGHQFADGPGGYLAQVDWVNGSVDAKTALLDYYSDMLRQAADSFQQADDNGAVSGSPAGQHGAPVGQGAGGPTSAGAIGGTPAAAATPALTNMVGQPANAVASPTTATGSGSPAGGIGSGSTGGGGSWGGPGSGGAAGQGDAADEDPGSDGVTADASAADGPSDDAASLGADAGAAAAAPVDAGTSQEALDQSTASPDTEPLSDAAGPIGSDPSAPPYLPPPGFPTPPQRRRAGAPDGPGPEDSESATPAMDGGSGLAEPSAAQVDPGKQRPGTGVDRPAEDAAGSPRAAGPPRSAAADGNSAGPEGAARARRRGPEKARRSGVVGDEQAADGIGLATGHSDDVAGSHPVGEQQPPHERPPTVSPTDHDESGVDIGREGAADVRLGDTDVAADGDVDDIAPGATEPRVSAREDSTDT